MQARQILQRPMIDVQQMHTLSHCCILIVDDDPVLCEIIRRILSYAQFTNLHKAFNSTQALHLIQQLEPDLILLDLNMPQMNGLQLCAKIRKLALQNPPAIVIHTSSCDRQNIAKAFDAGAVDYLTKPINSIEMVTRCVAHLERRQLEQKLHSEQQRMGHEFSEAAALQLALLPTTQQITHLMEQTGIQLASHTDYCSEMGGDIWGATLFAANQIAFYVVDVAGHGLRAALQTFRIHSMIQASAFQQNSAILLKTLNEKLVPTINTEQFVTMLHCVMDLNLMTLQYSNAGAPLPVIIRSFHPTIQLTGDGIPLGITDKANYITHHIRLKSGDKILFYSDALLESIPGVTLAYIARLIAGHPGNAGQIMEDLKEYIKNQLNEQNLSDDLTLLLVVIP